MAKTNKRKYVIGAVAAVAVIAGVWGGLYATCPKRAVKKALCSESPALCRCYTNIVDYRMTDKEIAMTRRYQEAMKSNPFVSPLEFADLAEVQHMAALLSVCEVEQAQQTMRIRALEQAAQQPIVAQPVAPAPVVKK